MAQDNDLPRWFQFFEDENENSSGEDDTDDTDDAEEENEEEDSGDTDDSDKPTGGNIEGLRSALRKERLARRKAEKDGAALRRAQQELADKDKTEVERLTGQVTTAADRVTKLASALRANAVNAAIVRAASTSGFTPRDMDDVLALIDRSDFDVDQDEDDPSKVTIDQDTISAAMKNLKKKKPHLFKADADEDDEDDSGASGSKVGSRGRRGKGSVDEDALKDKYPALKRY